MADSYITNGVTTLRFRPGSLVVEPMGPMIKRQSLISLPAAGISKVFTESDVKSRVFTASLVLGKEDEGVYAGMNSLYDFYAADDNTGVNGMGKTFMFTDSDGIVHQVRFAEEFTEGLRPRRKNTHYRGAIILAEEPLLPTYEAGLAGWWAAYDMDNNGGDLDAWTTNDAVGASGSTDWDDKSGNEYDATESTNTPQWQTSQINGRPAVHFDGSNDKLIADGVATLFDGQTDYEWSFYAVIRADSTTDTDIVASVGHSSLDDRIDFLRRNAATDWEAYIASGAANATEGGGTPDASNDYIFSALSDGENLSLYKNGSLITTTGSLNVAQVDVDSFTIGATEAAGTYQNFWDGKIGEIVLFNGVEHSTQQQRRQELRLSDMWGIGLDQ